MGIFDWLKTPKTNVDLLDEVIWLTKQAKFTGISASIGRCLAEPARPFAVLLVAHFRDCLEQVQAIVQQGGFDIQSRMVTRRIQVAAQKIESQAVSDVAADSADDRLQRNCPEPQRVRLAMGTQRRRTPWNWPHGTNGSATPSSSFRTRSTGN